ncbi:hypothetical protein [Pseudaminobacter sp. NGMCC 1.201702]|uniref:hypothetical protein n=1 Tax=Pseudaminobacter sp. NGMCC 1.201702 TaxID=3391825 RepID=UPI0039EFB896
MSRFIPQTDMSADQLMDCSYQAQALIHLCQFVAERISSGDEAARLGGEIEQALALAGEFAGIMHDALERQEGLKGGAK